MNCFTYLTYHVWLFEFCSCIMSQTSIFLYLTFLNHHCVSYISDVSLIMFCLMTWFIISHVCFSIFLLWSDSWLACIRCFKFHSVKCSNQLVWLNQFVWFIFTIFLLISFSFCLCFFLILTHLYLMIFMSSAFSKVKLIWVDWF